MLIGSNFESEGYLPGLNGLLGLVTVDQLERQLQCHLVFCAILTQAPLGHQHGPVPFMGVFSAPLLFGLTFKMFSEMSSLLSPKVNLTFPPLV